jgi:hypothetical protein
MSRPWSKSPLSFDAADIPHLNGAEPLCAAVAWGVGGGVRGGSLSSHAERILRWKHDGRSFKQNVCLTTVGQNLGEKRRGLLWCPQSLGVSRPLSAIQMGAFTTRRDCVDTEALKPNGLEHENE